MNTDKHNILQQTGHNDLSCAGLIVVVEQSGTFQPRVRLYMVINSCITSFITPTVTLNGSRPSMFMATPLGCKNVVSPSNQVVVMISSTIF